jgi:hypothetical protein
MLVRGPDPIETLPRSIRRPALFKVGRWVASPLPERGDKPEAKRLEVVMWLPVDDDDDELPSWDDVTATLGRSSSIGPLTVPVEALAAVAPDEVAAGATPEGDRVTLRGEVFPSRAFEGHGSTMARAIRLPGGLLVWLTTT